MEYPFKSSPKEDHTTSTQPGVSPASLASFFRCEAGATMIEYALVAAIISLGALGAMQTLGCQISVVYDNIGSSLTSAL